MVTREGRHYGKRLTKEEQVQRTIKAAQLLIQKDMTIRQVAAQTGFSKSTVFKDLSEKLALIDPGLYHQVSRILNRHWVERAERGGNATKRKWGKL